MSSSAKAVWVNGEIAVRGYWSYNWRGDRFSVSIQDTVPGLRNHDFVTTHDHPEWGNWKLVRNKELREKLYADPKAYAGEYTEEQIN